MELRGLKEHMTSMELRGLKRMEECEQKFDQPLVGQSSVLKCHRKWGENIKI